MVLFADSFDHYATADIAKKWTQSSNATIGSVGRNSSSGMRLSGSGSNGYAYVTTNPGSASEGGIGFAVKVNSLFTSASGDELVRILQADGTTQHVAVGLTSGGLFTGKRNTTTLGTSSAGITAGTFYYVEVKWVIHDSTGSIRVKVNGTEVLALTGVDTRNGGDGTWAIVVLQNGSSNASITVDLDDLVIWDTTGSDNNDFLGPIRLKAIFPDGAGNSTDFTPSTGSNYQNVDDTSQDGDSTYNSETTAGDHDTYTFGAVGVTGTVRFVQTNLMVRSNGAGAETIRPKIRISSTDYNGTTVGITTDYRDSREVFETSPATAAQWTVSEIDGAEFGIELVS